MALEIHKILKMNILSDYYTTYAPTLKSSNFLCRRFVTLTSVFCHFCEILNFFHCLASDYLWLQSLTWFCFSVFWKKSLFSYIIFLFSTVTELHLVSFFNKLHFFPPRLHSVTSFVPLPDFVFQKLSLFLCGLVDPASECPLSCFCVYLFLLWGHHLSSSASCMAPSPQNICC